MTIEEAQRRTNEWMNSLADSVIRRQWWYYTGRPALEGWHERIVALKFRYKDLP